MDRIESVFLGTDSKLLPILFAFYAPDAKVVRDVTANRRRMWKEAPTALLDTVKFYDIDPAMEPDVVCSWSDLVDATGSVDVLVYDPPHLPIAAASAQSSAQMIADYGLALSSAGENVSDLHPGFLKEAKRVLKKNGMIFAKIKDYVHNAKYQWCLADFMAQAKEVGLTPCDLIIKRDPCGGNLKSSKWKTAHHSRNCHCYWLIVRNGKCTV